MGENISNQYLFCTYEGASLSDSVYFDVTIDAADGLGGTAQDTTQITITPAAGGGCQPIPDPGLCDPPYDLEEYPEASHDGRSCYRTQSDCDSGVFPIGAYLG